MCSQHVKVTCVTSKNSMGRHRSHVTGMVPMFGGSQKGGFQKGGFGGCSPGTKTGTRVRSPKPPFWKPPFYLPVTLFGVDKRVVSKRVVSADVPPERKPERGYIRQNHPFTKPPFYLPVIQHAISTFIVLRIYCSCITMFQKSAHLQPGFSAGLGLFGASLPFVYIFHLLSAGFASFKCRFLFCPLGRKRERLKLSGNPLRAVL